MAACSACGKRDAVPGAGHPVLLLPLRLGGLKADGDGWCRGCALAHDAVGLLVWALLALLGYRLVSHFL